MEGRSPGSWDPIFSLRYSTVWRPLHVVGAIKRYMLLIQILKYDMHVYLDTGQSKRIIRGDGCVQKKIIAAAIELYSTTELLH